jgi:hypothetical protein
MIKDTPIKEFAKALLLQEWFQVMKKEHSKETAKKLYYAYILSKNEPQSVKNKTIGFLRKIIDIRTPESQIACLFLGSFIIAGGYAVFCSPHFTTRSFFGRPLLVTKTIKALVPIVGETMPVVGETVTKVLVHQAVCKVLEYSAELALSKELICLLPILGEPGMAPIIEGVIRASMFKKGRLNVNFGGLNHTKFTQTPNFKFE